MELKMKNFPAIRSLMLRPGELQSLSLNQEKYLRVDCGRVWLTVTGDETDYWLEDGAGMRLPAGRHVVIEADGRFSRLELAALDEQGAVPVRMAQEQEPAPALDSAALTV
jgi:hypothetical protein